MTNDDFAILAIFIFLFIFIRQIGRIFRRLDALQERIDRLENITSALQHSRNWAERSLRDMAADIDALRDRYKDVV